MIPKTEKKIETLLIRGGRVVDPSVDRDGVFDVLIEGEKITRVAKTIAPPAGAHVLEAKGMIVAPGLVDLCVHLREPGNEGAENIETGTRAAAAGGVTGLVCMPDTDPLIDEESGVQFILRRSAETACVRVWPAGALTMGESPERLGELGAMAKAGAVVASDAGQVPLKSLVLRRGLEYAKAFDLPVMLTPEDRFLAPDGVMNEGPLATRLGHRGVPRQSEAVSVARSLALAELTGAHVILGPLTTREGVDLLREAKRRRLPVTAWTAPHYFSLTEESVVEHGTLAKVSPPLRSAADRDALVKGLADGTLDVIASDHGPQSRSAKEQEFSQAPFGIIGLETMLPLAVTRLVEPGHLSWLELIRRLSTAPADVLGVPAGKLAEGAPADVVIIDPAEERKLSSFSSKSQNSPFLGVTLRGFPQAVIVGGQMVLRREALKTA
jgi:dihydroorotase